MSARTTALVIATLLACGPAFAEDPAGDPWSAWDHLDPAAGCDARPGWRVELRGLTREAVDDEWESTLRAAREPASGFGFAAEWRRAWSDRAGSADDTSLWLAHRGARTRIAAGAGRLAFAGEGAARAMLDARVQVAAPLLAGLRVSLIPGEGARAAEVMASLHAGLGATWCGVELGPGASDLRVALGIETAPGVAWTAAWSGTAPTLGIALRRGPAELRAEETAHPYLGSVSSIRLVLGGVR